MYLVWSQLIIEHESMQYPQFLDFGSGVESKLHSVAHHEAPVGDGEPSSVQSFLELPLYLNGK